MSEFHFQHNKMQIFFLTMQKPNMQHVFWMLIWSNYADNEIVKFKITDIWSDLMYTDNCPAISI